MTNNEIIKALECCADGTFRCDECCYEHLKFNECTPLILNDALDLINRQKAEIERLEKENETFAKRFYKTGVKDIAEKVKHYCTHSVEFKDWFEEDKLISYIDNLVNEMVGDSDV